MTRLWIYAGLVPIALLASSCTLFKKAEPVIKTEYVNVSVPVKVPCLKPDQVPKQPKRLSEATPQPETLTEMVGWMRATLKIWQDDYGPTAEELLKICAKLSTR